MTTSPLRLRLRRLALLTGIAGMLAVPLAAQARVFVGLGFGVPVAPYYYPPPVYAPPPVYYPPPAYAAPPPAYAYSPAPPPVEAAPAAGYASGYGATCYAGVYVCQTGQSMPVGSQCSCPGLGARSYGTVR